MLICRWWPVKSCEIPHEVGWTQSSVLLAAWFWWLLPRILVQNTKPETRIQGSKEWRWYFFTCVKVVVLAVEGPAVNSQMCVCATHARIKKVLIAVSIKQHYNVSYTHHKSQKILDFIVNNWKIRRFQFLQKMPKWTINKQFWGK